MKISDGQIFSATLISIHFSGEIDFYTSNLSYELSLTEHIKPLNQAITVFLMLFGLTEHKFTWSNNFAAMARKTALLLILGRER